MTVTLDFRLNASRRVPFVSASHLNECGLACMAALSEFHRGELGLAEIRAMAPTSTRGNTLLELRDLGERLGLSSRGVKVTLDAVDQLCLPAILHWDMNHFVVLENVDRRGLVIMDPAAGRMRIGWQVADKSFTGIALEATPSEAWRKRVHAKRKFSAFDLLSSVSNWKTGAGLIVGLSLLLEVLVLLLPLQLQMAVDHAVASSDGRLIWVLGGAFTIGVLMHGAISLVRAWSASVLGARFGFDLMDSFVRALHRKPASFFLNHNTADILNRARSVDAIQSIVTAQLLQAMINAVMSVLMLTIMLVSVPLLGSVVAVFGAINLAVVTSLRRAALDVSRRSLRASARTDRLFLENARSARAIRLFGKENVRIAVWRNRFVDKTNLVLADSRLVMYANQAAQLMGNLGNVMLISAGTYLVLESTITLGTMLMFFVFRAFFVERLNSCITYLMDLRRVETHAERIEEVLKDDASADGTASDVPSFSVSPDIGVGIEVRDIWFRYSSEGPWILRGVSLKVEPGESVAITGSSGCGKSTLLHVMLGLLTPQRGEVLVNGRSLKTISSADYAKVIGVVLQDDVLFQGTVADNISFFDSPIDMERVMKASEQANIAADIRAMPMRYYSLLAESASDISGGQKQRLFIARAIYHQPNLLFLDEATSHLDLANEQLVSQAIQTMSLTRVLVAHRKDTIATADRVVVLEAISSSQEGSEPSGRLSA